MHLLNRILRKRELQISRTPRGALKLLLKQYDVDFLIDVGCNHGQFARTVRATGWEGQITSFDPIAECAGSLTDIKKLSFTCAAVGRASGGAININIYDSTDFSSAFELNKRYGAEYENAPQIKEKRNVPVVALDEVTFHGRRGLLKIDTQGYELEVLAGASKTLEQIALLHIECPFYNIYRGGCSASDVFAATEALGFFPARIFPVSITKSGAWIDADVIFVRKPTS